MYFYLFLLIIQPLKQSQTFTTVHPVGIFEISYSSGRSEGFVNVPEADTFLTQFTVLFDQEVNDTSIDVSEVHP